MKTDNYLSLCLQQASKSPLHYRHGCIIVRGGKVIGAGYNDFRPGFNGGALKHGRLANRASDGPAIADLKEKLKKQKDKPGRQQNHQSNEMKPTTTFVTFEGTGAGHQANVPLSMHGKWTHASRSRVLFCCILSDKLCFKSTTVHHIP